MDSTDNKVDGVNENKSVVEESDVVKREAYEGVTKDLHKFKAKAREEAAARAELEVKLKAYEEQKLAEEQKWKELYEKRTKEIETVKQQVEQEKNNYLKTVKMAALKAELGNIKDTYLIHADLSSIEINEDGSLNPESVRSVANKFREEHSMLIPSSGNTTITNPAPSSKTVQPKKLSDLSIQERLALLKK